MRPGHEPSEVLDLPGGRSHRFVNPERFSAALRSTWTWQGTEAFLGLRAATGRVSVPTKGDSPSALIQKGDWCGSATRPTPRERKPKVRSRTGQRASRQDIGSRRRRERKKRPFDRGQLNGDTPGLVMCPWRDLVPEERLARRQPHPCGELSPVAKLPGIADRGGDRRGCQGADAFDLHQPCSSGSRAWMGLCDALRCTVGRPWARRN